MVVVVAVVVVVVVVVVIVLVLVLVVVVVYGSNHKIGSVSTSTGVLFKCVIDWGCFVLYMYNEDYNSLAVFSPMMAFKAWRKKMFGLRDDLNSCCSRIRGVLRPSVSASIRNCHRQPETPTSGTRHGYDVQTVLQGGGFDRLCDRLIYYYDEKKIRGQ